MNYLCVFDLDDTLLSADKTVSVENLEALRKLRDLDVGISIATGRSIFMTGLYIELLSLNIPVITCNGAVLVSADRMHVIYENPIEKSLITRLFIYLLEQRSDFIAYTNQTVYYSKDSIRVNIFKGYNQTVPAAIQAPLQMFSLWNFKKENPDIVKILLYSPTPEQESYLKGMNGLEVLSSGENFLDIMQAGSTKGNAVRALGRYMDIPVENIAVFGDNENDVSMFACGALGIAMANSRDDIKRKARFVTGSNLESGVAAGIYKYVLPYFGMG